MYNDKLLKATSEVSEASIYHPANEAEKRRCFFRRAAGFDGSTLNAIPET